MRLIVVVAVMRSSLTASPPASPPVYSWSFVESQTIGGKVGCFVIAYFWSRSFEAAYFSSRDHLSCSSGGNSCLEIARTN